MAVTEISEFEAKKKKLIKKKKQSRAKRRFIILLFLLVCIGTIFVVLKAPFFNVKTIVCVGQTSLSQDEVIKIAGAKTNVNIFSTGVGTMKRRLASHPSIAESNVRRLFPNKIKIWVRESKAVACVENNGVFLLMDKHGRIIKAADEKTKDIANGVARLENFKPASTKVGEYIFSNDDAVHNITLECIKTLDNLGVVGEITKMDVSDLSDIKIQYQNRLSILLGSYEDMEYKLTFIKKVIEENISKYEKAVLDYRGSSLYVGSTAEEEPPAETEKQPSADGSEADKTVTAEDSETKILTEN